MAVKKQTVDSIDLRLPGRLRASDVQRVLRIGRTWLDAGVKSGRYPAPDYVEGHLRFWKNSTILHFLEPPGEGKK